MNYPYPCRISTYFVLLIVSFRLMSPSPTLSQPSLQEIADQMEATLKAIGDHAVLYTVQRDGPDGYVKLVLSGRESPYRGRCFREEIYQYKGVPDSFREMAIFDGTISRSFNPASNQGSIQGFIQGDNFLDILTVLPPLLLSPDSPENYYRRIVGADISDILRGKVHFIQPESTVRYLDDRYIVVNLNINSPNSEVRYQVTFDKDHGMLPVKIFRQSRPDGYSPWKDVLQHSILEWMPLENGVHYPKTGVQTIYHEEIQPTRLEVLSLVQDVDIQSLADSFVFPAGCEITDHRTGSRTKIERTSSDTGIDIEPQQISFFPKALGITLDDAMAMFNDILKE